MSWWKLVYWAVGTLGVGGIIALLAFYPMVLTVIWTVIKRILSYRAGCALIAALIAWTAADYRRHSMDDAFYAEKTVAFERAQDARDARIRTDTRELVWKEIADATAANTATDNEVKDFTNALPKPSPTGNPFLIGDADADWLCRISGKAQCGPRRAQGVPKARR